MKSLIFIYIFIFIVQSTFAQAPDILWEHGYGGNHDDRGYEVLETLDGGFLMVGQEQSIDGDIIDNHGLDDVYVVKTDMNGEIIWSRAYGGSDYDYGKAACLAHDGGYIIAGNSGSMDGNLTGNNGFKDLWVFKLDDLGDIVWQFNYGGSHNEGIKSIIPTSDGGYLGVGTSQSNDGGVIGHHGEYGAPDIWVVKFDLTGNMLWNKCFGSSEFDYVEGAIETQDGNYIFVGHSEGYDGEIGITYGDYDVVLMKISPDGELIWSKNFGGSWPDYGASVIELANGQLMILSETQSDDGLVEGYYGATDIWLFKTDANGNFIWGEVYGGTGIENTYDLIAYTDNQFIIASVANFVNGDIEFTHGGNDFWILGVDSLGEILWQKSIGGSLSDLPYSIKKINDDEIIISGYSNSIDYDVTPTYGSLNVWTVKLGFCTTKYYADTDGDGFGDISFDTLACEIPLGYALDSTDCNDLNPEIHPTLTDICNAIDDNCNGLTDEDATFVTYFADIDGDTFGDILNDSTACNELIGYVLDNSDCNDTNNAIYPGATELCNYLDDNCDGFIDDNLTYILSYQDNDGDDFGNPLIDSISCELPIGFVEDNTDCDDTNPEIYPGATEMLNGLDDDCDQIADEGLATTDIVKNTISIFPNPVNAILFIQSDATQHITIVNQLGEEILHTDLLIGLNTISVADFASGVYWVKVENGEMVIWVKE
ncbi:MAG: T9SS type A sorting domain-containing protein [Bacteroidetes bacterium]|nr:T9SS type A sorting domain-containing protein [Bacteroidota bacterium]MBP9879585.1 T9SS type A sorting domain-containing protein [Chitinophagales bacterium]